VIARAGWRGELGWHFASEADDEIEPRSLALALPCRKIASLVVAVRGVPSEEPASPPHESGAIGHWASARARRHDEGEAQVRLALDPERESSAYRSARRLSSSRAMVSGFTAAR